MEANQVKVCSRCHRELPIENFNRCGNGYQSWCRDCKTEYSKEKRNTQRGQRAKGNPALKDFTPRELLDELFFRGYRGTLEFKEVKIHKITL